MISPTRQQINKFSSVFEFPLLAEMETKAMVLDAKEGQALLAIGQPIRAVPLVIEGTLKVSRVNEDGQELLLYYVREKETCAMSFTCWMTAQVSSIKGVAEEDSLILCIPVNVLDEWMGKYSTFKKFVMNTIL